ncbi:aminodeoxychorismate lyase [Kribbella sp. ALI-6-A]|uniref:endolytic transglycosylase MltG n=1 Tax=Kribbella sp. ALI-6-A TaxID=1933817 RepID=UPI00097BFE6F|nr:endolytic transglycosylase MltG [Kribbella sp. ALI-6-A]ONI74270.1 aminodeoxychorismate lyase [Kribbella sp. ALI-6-A]
MSRTSTHGDLDETDDLDVDLGLRPESRTERRANRRKHRARRGFGCFAGLVSLLVVAGLIGGLMFGFGKGRDYLEQMFAAPDYEGEGTGSVQVEVTKGQSAQAIADTLEKKDVVKSARAFERAAREDPRSVQIQAATFTLRKKMSAKAALALMLDPAKSIRVTRIGVNSGWTKEQVAQKLQENKTVKLPPGSVAAAMAKPWSLGLPSYAKNNPEGFLYPGTYDVPKNATAYSILRLMTAQFARTQAELKLPQTAQRKKLDPYQAVIVASIIAAETNRPEDYGKVARVIYNRLQRDMKLQMDSTVHYVTGRSGGVFTTDEERDYDSPYNTYKYRDLPPTPINSPGKDTLRAALNATPGPWLYFTLVNLDTGETAFAATAEEHQQNVRKLQAWCQAHKGRC